MLPLVQFILLLAMAGLVLMSQGPPQGPMGPRPRP